MSLFYKLHLLKKKPIILWALLMVICYGLVGFTYYATQQNYRLTANDPQIQLTEDGTTQLNQGQQPKTVIDSHDVDIASSLAPFTIIIDKQLNIIATNANYNGATPPLPPHGVFPDADIKGELRFTWQTESGLRFATVVHPTKAGYIVAARSLREVEKRESLLTQTMILGLGLLMLGSFIIIAILA